MLLCPARQNCLGSRGAHSGSAHQLQPAPSFVFKLEFSQTIFLHQREQGPDFSNLHQQKTSGWPLEKAIDIRAVMLATLLSAFRAAL
jgi:hypothetical protein